MCHPERSRAKSKANGPAQSKDPYRTNTLQSNPATRETHVVTGALTCPAERKLGPRRNLNPTHSREISDEPTE